VPGQLARRLHAHALGGALQRLPGHDRVRTLAHVAERRGVGHRLVDVEREQAADLRRLLLPASLRGVEGLVRGGAARVLHLLHMVGERVDQVVRELPVAQPGVAQQVQVRLRGTKAAEVVDGIEVRQARVIEQVLLRDTELRQERLGDRVQRVQRGALLALARHLPPAKILGVLPQHRQLRQRVVACDQLCQRGRGVVVQHLGQQIAKAAAFRRQRRADQFLQRGVPRADNLVVVERDD